MISLYVLSSLPFILPRGSIASTTILTNSHFSEFAGTIQGTLLMATLVRTQVVPPAEQDESQSLRTSVPKPFPTAEEREQLLQEALLEELAEEQVEYEAPANGRVSQCTPQS